MNQPVLSPLTVSRREALKAFGASAVALAAAMLPARAFAADSTMKTSAPAAGAAAGPLVLPPLGFAYDALEPAIDARTMEIHYTKHHQAYIDNANKALAGHPELAAMSAEEILRSLGDAAKVPAAVATALRNNVGGHVNHTLFWDILAPGGATKPGGALAAKIDADLGSFDALQRQLSEAAAARFGSGWAWLVVKAGRLAVISAANQDSPVTDGATPIAGIDVWEHAYYLKYQNRRPDYVKAALGVLNWDRIGRRYEAAFG